MSAMVYENGAYKEAETPKAWNGSAFVDTDGYYWENGVQKEGWSVFKWITSITAKYAKRPLVTINGQGSYSISNDKKTVYMKSPIVNTSYGDNTASPIIGIDNNGRYKSMSFKVSSLTSNNKGNEGSSRACIMFFSVDDKSAFTEIGPQGTNGFDLLLIGYFTLNTTITLTFSTGVFSGGGSNVWTEQPVNKRYFGFFPTMNSNMSAVDGDYGECRLTDIVFNK